ncbi:class I SAM-dependent methyltransferase [Hoeflea sp.]|uniref:class I SAM-dependent methyltransferase n=1 Tax=Hoeflea sp. TaxID=1940281 RepID=UPI003B01AE83
MDKREAIAEVFERYKRRGYGTVNQREAYYIQELIEQHRPRRFLEIGMASGLSGGLIASFMEKSGGESFISLDFASKFFGDPHKPVGFLIDQIYTGKKVHVSIRPQKTALDLPEFDETFDMVFVDGNHQHPWPTIDTLFVKPYLTGNQIVIHHDRMLYQAQENAKGIGPKYLYDQFPESVRSLPKACGGNIYSLDLVSLSQSDLVRYFSDLFLFPWTLMKPLEHDAIEKVSNFIHRHYGKLLHDAFITGARRYNVPKGAFG